MNVGSSKYIHRASLAESNLAKKNCARMEMVLCELIEGKYQCLPYSPIL
jgi:hypothetical protein